MSMGRLYGQGHSTGRRRRTVKVQAKGRVDEVEKVEEGEGELERRESDETDVVCFEGNGALKAHGGRGQQVLAASSSSSSSEDPSLQQQWRPQQQQSKCSQNSVQ